MKKDNSKKFKKIALSTTLGLALLSPMMLSGCDNDNGTVDNSTEAQIKEIYSLAVDAGYQGTYEDWLATVKGERGQAGRDGATPTIGQDGYWYINGASTGVKATGENGDDGATPTIGQDGYWYINGQKTEVKAQGTAGNNGVTPKLRINSETNMWEVSYDNETTWTSLGVKATGENGTAGSQGSQGVAGKGIAGITGKYEFDDEGNLRWVMEITYTDSTTQSISTPIPKKATGFSLSTHEIDAVEGDDEISGVTLDVYFEDGTSAEVELKRSMISGIEDFSVPGLYSNVRITYNGYRQNTYLTIYPTGEHSTLDLSAQIQTLTSGMLTKCDIYGADDGHGYCVLRNEDSSLRSLNVWKAIQGDDVIVTGEGDEITAFKITDGVVDLYTLDTTDLTPAKEYTGTLMGDPTATVKTYAVDGFAEGYEAYEITVGGNSYYGIKATTSNIVALNDTVVVLSDSTFAEAMFEVNGHYYVTLADAVAGAEAEQNITLLGDVTVEETVTIDKKVGIDLDSHTLSGSTDTLLKIANQVSITGGTIELDTVTGKEAIRVLYGETCGELNLFEVEINANNNYGIFAESATAVTISDCEITSATQAIRAMGDDDKEKIEINVSSTEITVNGGTSSTQAIHIQNAILNTDSDTTMTSNGYGLCVFKGCTANINSTITAEWFAISTNGNLGNGGLDIVLGYEANLTSADDCAIYMNNTNSLTINGASITGNTALYIKSGTVNINGGTFTATGSEHAYSYYGGGAHSTGEAIVVDSCGYPTGAPTINISDGEITIDNIDNDKDGKIISYNYHGSAAATINNNNVDIEVVDVDIPTT